MPGRAVRGRKPAERIAASMAFDPSTPRPILIICKHSTPLFRQNINSGNTCYFEGSG
jgi:hypothetical protein